MDRSSETGKVFGPACLGGASVRQHSCGSPLLRQTHFQTLGGLDAASMVAALIPNLSRSRSSTRTARLLGTTPDPNLRAYPFVISAPKKRMQAEKKIQASTITTDPAAPKLETIPRAAM